MGMNRFSGLYRFSGLFGGDGPSLLNRYITVLFSYVSLFWNQRVIVYHVAYRSLFAAFHYLDLSLDETKS